MAEQTTKMIMIGAVLLVGVILIGLAYWLLSGNYTEMPGDFHGNDIGLCGSYATIAEIQKACNTDPMCKGYSTKYDVPHCLKSKLEDYSADAPGHMFYKKKL